MVRRDDTAAATPMMSVVVAVYNDWEALDGCLRALSGQSQPPSFEVVIVDDGSNFCAPESIVNWGRCYPLRVTRQSHAGIATARNQGMATSRGSILVFMDADCRPQSGCLAALEAALARWPGRNHFQLRLEGDCSSLVGRAEQLRLVTLQHHLLLGDGSIRYLNTAGFAVRRTRTAASARLFDPAVLRGEDTLLLVNLMEAGDLPVFVAEAVVQHAIQLTFTQCLRKDARSVYLERNAYRIIAAKGFNVRVSYRERLRMLGFMWKSSGRPGIGRSAWFALTFREALERVISLGLTLCASGFDRLSGPNRQAQP